MVLVNFTSAPGTFKVSLAPPSAVTVPRRVPPSVAANSGAVNSKRQISREMIRVGECFVGIMIEGSAIPEGTACWQSQIYGLYLMPVCDRRPPSLSKMCGFEFSIRDMRTWPGGKGLVIVSQIAGTARIEIRPEPTFGYDFKYGNEEGYHWPGAAKAALFFT